jgi:lipid-binding SYLF domain-containing protein
MKTIVNLTLVLMLITIVVNLNAEASIGESKSADSEKAEKTLENAIMPFYHVMKDSKNGIPQSLINKSEGIMIFPEACKVAAGVYNGQGGRGIAMIRNDDGNWSNPFIVSLGKGNLGSQTGTQTSDIIMFFLDRNDIIDIDKVYITLGGDISVAAGPSDKGSSSSNDMTFESDSYSYYLNKGLFNGVNLNGGILSYNERISESLYDVDDLSTDEIFCGNETTYDDKVNDLIEALVMSGE